MGFRFRRILSIIPGLRVNLSKSGASLSIGRPGATVNLNEQGARLTVGVPGSGMSYQTKRVPLAQKESAQPKLSTPEMLALLPVEEQRMVHDKAVAFTALPVGDQLAQVRDKLNEMARAVGITDSTTRVSARLGEMARHPRCTREAAVTLRACKASAEEFEEFLEERGAHR
jgi:hypothetical protein